MLLMISRTGAETARKPLGLCAAVSILCAAGIVLACKLVAAEPFAPTRVEQLRTAACAGDIATLRGLLSATPAGDDDEPRCATGDLETALSFAALYGQERSVVELLAHGVDANCRGQRRVTPLMMLVHRDDDVALAIARRLIRAGADVNAADVDGRTTLIDAAASGRVELVRLLLLEAGADAALADRHGETALDVAERAGHRDIIDLLRSPATAATNPAAGARKTPAGDV